MTVESIKDWWRLYYDKVILVVLIAVATVTVIVVGWYIYQTAPASLSEGVVTDRDFTPEHWEQETRSRQVYDGETCSGTGSSRVCTSHYHTQYYTVDVWYNDDWDLRIDGCSNNRRGDTICRNEWIDVSHSTYDDCDITEHWRKETACHPQ